MSLILESVLELLEGLTLWMFLYSFPIAVGVAGFVVIKVGIQMRRHPVAMAIGYGLVTFAATMGLIISLVILMGQI